MSIFVTRFAPSPTGFLHIGHVASARAAWFAAQAAGGDVLLRLEDIDQTRCRSAYAAAILEDLRWLGFDWPLPVRRQSHHFEDYRSVLETLIQAGLCYRCFRTRKEVMADIGRAPHGAPLAFRGKALSEDEEQEKLASGAPFAWRLSLSRARDKLGARWEDLSYVSDWKGRQVRVPAEPELLGDVILARKDTPTSYHLAVTHDDALQNITHVVRGEDLEPSTHIHVLIQALMDWPTPVYTHHKLLLGKDGKRFAKRDQSQTIAALREAGHSPESVIAMARL